MPSAVFRVLLIACGTLCVALGVIGIFVPLMPTTVFLLMAAACYARSSDRLYQRLANHSVLGVYIRSHRGMPRRAKVVTLVLLWASMTATMIWTAQAWWLRVLLLLIAAAVTAHVARIPGPGPEASRVPDRAAS